MYASTHDYLIRPDDRFLLNTSYGRLKPASSETYRIAEAVRQVLLFYDPDVSAEIRHEAGVIASTDGTGMTLRVHTRIVNGEIVDSAVRVSSIPFRLLASRRDELATHQ